jgi:hypothetical protein
MSPKDFAGCIHREVIEDNLRSYDHLLARPLEQIRDATWRKIAQTYATMNNDQQEALRLLARQVMVDTASNILGILDGSSILESYRKEFSLTYGTDSDRLNGELQDYFLAEMEDDA